ncbi:MAG TPA: glycine cleavage system protein H [Chloroflexota bacterium]|nr:glycine cleavage system protein H [Chloroflexota bacterium]HUM71324.1 glycine cleavage system protein H [Chloroflexota bacterium]
MVEYLEFTLDKFTFKVATDRYYHPDGVWAKEANDRVTIGLSDFLQQRSGDIAFAEVAEVGTALAAGDEVANIETIKVDVSLPSPVTGTVLEVNPRLELEAEVINQSPYEDGWLAVIEAANWETDRANLLQPDAYFAHMQVEAEEEVKKL